MKMLSKVEDSFELPGRGCIIVPGVPDPGTMVPVVRVKDKIQLRKPDGQIVDTHVAGIEILCGPNARHCNPILLPKDVSREDVPIGTEVWHVVEDKASVPHRPPDRAR